LLDAVRRIPTHRACGKSSPTSACASTPSPRWIR